MTTRKTSIAVSLGDAQLDLWPGLPGGQCPACRWARPNPAGCGRCALRLERVSEPQLSWAQERAIVRGERMRIAAERAAAECALAERVTRLAALGRPVRVALVGCGADKREGRHPARDLYLGALFRAGLRHAEATADETLIVSALHPVVDPDQPINAYDRSLDRASKAEREAWGRRVVSDLTARYAGLRVEVTIYAGATYADAIEGALRLVRRSTETASGLAMWRWLTPLAGLGVGRRLGWYKAARLAREAGDAAKRPSVEVAWGLRVDSASNAAPVARRAA